MSASRTNRNRPGKTKSSRSRNSLRSNQALDHAVVLVDTVCCLAGDENLIGNQSNPEIIRLRRAIADHDTPYLFAVLMEAFSLQGISDQAAYSFMERHGRLTWHDLQQATRKVPVCSKLRCYWTFAECGYRKSTRLCAEPELFAACSVPTHDLRNGRLNQIGYSLFLFIRDVADGDLVQWIDRRLQHANEGSSRRRMTRMVVSLIEPLTNIFGVSNKVASMSLAYLLTSASREKPLWLEAGASMIAIDTLVHNFLHRTGILRRFKAQHGYGTACYEANGCADLIARVAKRIDVRKFNPNYPRYFPRFAQHAIWRYCAGSGGLGVCNGNEIDDRFRCGNRGCPLFHLDCERIALHATSNTG
jgi:hypothetical protein